MASDKAPQPEATPVPAPPPPDHCLLCGRPLLGRPGGFMAARFARFLPPGGAAELAEVLDHPAGESEWVAICTSCALAPFWTIAQRAIHLAGVADEAAAAGGKG